MSRAMLLYMCIKIKYRNAYGSAGVYEYILSLIY